jgi:hypothetical protein
MRNNQNENIQGLYLRHLILFKTYHFRAIGFYNEADTLIPDTSQKAWKRGGVKTERVFP